MSKKSYLMSLLTTMMVAMLSVGFVSCGDDDDNDDGLQPTGTVSEQDPEGTVVINMNNERTSYDIKIGSLCISEDNNFYGWGGEGYTGIASVGHVSGLSKITKVPESGWASSVAVVPGDGYVIQFGKSYARIYVVSYITNTSGSIIGATIKYQAPWEVGGSKEDDQPQDYTATKTVKKATIKRTAQIGDVDAYDKFSFYEDYESMYCMTHVSGKLDIVRFHRLGGAWQQDKGDDGISREKETGFKCVGEVPALNSIEKGNYWGVGFSNSYYVNYFADFFPQNGYVCCFTTSSGEQKYMRIFTESYTLDAIGSLETVTIQYQLF